MTKMFSLESVIADSTWATGATACSGAVVDTDGYENVLLIGQLESTNANAQLVAKGGSATASLSEYTGPETGEASGVAKTLYLDIHRPKFRYIQGTVFASAGAQNANIITILYGPRSMPTSNSTLVNGRQLYTPNTGTATVSG